MNRDVIRKTVLGIAWTSCIGMRCQSLWLPERNTLLETGKVSFGEHIPLIIRDPE